MDLKMNKNVSDKNHSFMQQADRNLTVERVGQGTDRRKLRILVVIASYGESHLEYIRLSLIHI